MDPNANLAEQEAVIARIIMSGKPSMVAELRDLQDTLTEWLSKGGFEPDWSKAPNARKYYGRWENSETK